jgi:RNA polymerase sigma-70 factor (ECF subfamily)
MDGSADSFAIVAERAAPRLYRTAMRLCGNPADAEDLVQDTLLQGFRKWAQFEGRSDPQTWLYAIAGRLCQRRHRRRAGEPRHMESLSTLLPTPADPLVTLPSDDPASVHLRKVAEETVAAALAALPVAFRLPLVLSDIAELGTREIAAILGLKEATVKTRLHRARLQLRRALLDRLPGRPGQPPSHERQVCLDLLRAKQESLDRRVPFPYSSEALCERCRTVFDTLDFSRAVCGRLDQGGLPPSITALLRAHDGQ